MDKMPQQAPGEEISILASEVVLQAIPFFGGAIAAIFGKAAREQYDSRLTKWFEDLGEAVSKLQIKLENLAQDPELVETVVAATAAAGKTMHEEKLFALRNAVLNSVDPILRPDEDLRLRFIGIIEQMVPDHLRLMKYFSSPRRWYEERQLSIPSITTTRSLAINGLGWENDDAARPKRLMEDLVTWRLTGLVSETMGTDGQIDRDFVTEDGKAFMRYIDEPASFEN
ncbi:hypothetical protein RN04_03615 [Arthrobacter sp. W1]|nr:hypothetical protein RN04_03615 [Arthrobacter sp. W1]